MDLMRGLREAKAVGAALSLAGRGQVWRRGVWSCTTMAGRGPEDR